MPVSIGLPSGTEFPKVSSLSEITIEEDKKALDEFLSAGDGAHEGQLTFPTTCSTFNLCSVEMHFPQVNLFLLVITTMGLCC